MSREVPRIDFRALIDFPLTGFGLAIPRRLFPAERRPLPRSTENSAITTASMSSEDIILGENKARIFTFTYRILTSGNADMASRTCDTPLADVAGEIGS